MDWYTIVSTVAIPFVVGFLKKIKLPTKYAPVACLVIASIFVIIGQLAGLTLDLKTITEALLKVLGTAGVAVLGYDQVKKLTEVK